MKKLYKFKLITVIFSSFILTFTFKGEAIQGLFPKAMSSHLSMLIKQKEEFSQHPV